MNIKLVMQGTLVTIAALFLGACDLPRPEGVSGCNDDFYMFDRRATDAGNLDRRADFTAVRVGPSPREAKVYEDLAAAIREMPAGTPQAPRYLNVLVLSGGGEWGAYGAGFLNGWRAADRLSGGAYSSKGLGPAYPPQQRADIHIVTGISTGAAQAPAAYVGATSDPQVAADTDRRLTDQYTAVTQDSLIRARPGGQLSVLFSNSLYSVEGLEDQAGRLVGDYFDAIRRMPAYKRLYVGTVNVDRNRFVIADLKAMIDRAGEAGRPSARACVAHSLLASAAVPVAFPPRFIDREMYVDGNVRHGVFATLLFSDQGVQKEMRKRFLIPYFSVIVNGNQSSDTFREVKQPMVENGALAVAGRAVSNMLDQVGKDSVYQIENELIGVFGRSGEGGRPSYYSRYTYVDNRTIRESELPECRAARAVDNDLVFDSVFMKCLYRIGLADGQNQAWRDFYAMPPAAAAPRPPRPLQ